jgi:hypothetical protein
MRATVPAIDKAQPWDFMVFALQGDTLVEQPLHCSNKCLVQKYMLNILISCAQATVGHLESHLLQRKI